MFQLTLKDGKVIDEKTSQPDLREIALEHFRRAVSNLWEIIL